MFNSRRRFALITAAALSLALGFAACGGGDDGGGAAPFDPNKTAFTVEMKDNSFSTKAITVAAGKEITFELPNKGQIIHNMTAKVDGKDIRSDPSAVKGGETGKLVVTFPKAGTYDYICDFHPAEMTGKITAQ